MFAYEGAVSLSMAEQKPHPNPVKGTSVEEEAHPTTKEWVGELFRCYPDQLEWVNCGLCVDERGGNNRSTVLNEADRKTSRQWCSAPTTH